MNPKKLIVVLILILIIGGIIAGGVIVYRGAQGKGDSPIISIKDTPTPTPTETPTPTPTPTPTEISLSDYKIQVLNGSGAPGEAGAVRDLIGKEGAKDVATDNADSYDYKDTEIQFKKEVEEEIFAKLKEILSDYDVVKGKILPESSDYDIIIIVGVKE